MRLISSRHAPIERPQACLYVRHWNMQFDRAQRSSCGRIGIAVDNHHVRSFGQHDRFERLQHSSGHVAMPSAVDAEVIGRLRDAQLRKEYVRHGGIEMLSRVHHDLDKTVLGELARQSSCLDELRSGANDGKDVGRHIVQC